MSLFTPDLYRNFAIGFVVGALGLAAANAENLRDTIESPAHAAAPMAAPQIEAEFVIRPLDETR